MLKHGLIHSKSYWNEIKNLNEIEIEGLEELLWESVLIKNSVITEDPFENNLRKTLNYGHTLGHAIESYCLDDNEIKPLLHGEAIAIGMVLTTFLSGKLLGFPKDTLEDISSSILKKFEKVTFKSVDIDEIIKLLIYDKKNTNGKILFVLLEDIGIHKINCEVPNNLIIEAFEYYKNYK